MPLQTVLKKGFFSLCSSLQPLKSTPETGYFKSKGESKSSPVISASMPGHTENYWRPFFVCFLFFCFLFKMAQMWKIAVDYLKVYLSFAEGVGSIRTDGTVASNSSLSMSPQQWHPSYTQMTHCISLLKLNSCPWRLAQDNQLNTGTRCSWLTEIKCSQ